MFWAFPGYHFLSKSNLRRGRAAAGFRFLQNNSSELKISLAKEPLRVRHIPNANDHSSTKAKSHVSKG
jgi:hypothetical protein